MFEHPEDATFFAELLCMPGESVSAYEYLFDFRAPNVKRAEFNRIASKVRQQLAKRDGPACRLRCCPKCEIDRATTIDHIIPLSSNKLNKRLRKLQPAPSKKVPTQSFGSNDLRNLVLACEACNGFKKHRLPEREIVTRLLALTAG